MHIQACELIHNDQSSSHQKLTRSLLSSIPSNPQNQHYLLSNLKVHFAQKKNPNIKQPRKITKYNKILRRYEEIELSV